jgi:hypothetical protein
MLFRKKTGCGRLLRGLTEIPDSTRQGEGGVPVPTSKQGSKREQGFTPVASGRKMTASPSRDSRRT